MKSKRNANSSNKTLQPTGRAVVVIVVYEVTKARPAAELRRSPSADEG
jgi:hypothetical protein